MRSTLDGRTLCLNANGKFFSSQIDDDVQSFMQKCTKCLAKSRKETVLSLFIQVNLLTGCEILSDSLHVCECQQNNDHELSCMAVVVVVRMQILVQLMLSFLAAKKLILGRRTSAK